MARNNVSYAEAIRARNARPGPPGARRPRRASILPRKPQARPGAKTRPASTLACGWGLAPKAAPASDSAPIFPMRVLQALAEVLVHIMQSHMDSPEAEAASREATPQIVGARHGAGWRRDEVPG